MQLCSSLNIIWHCLSLGLEWKLSCGHCWVFQICWHIECSTFTASSFMIWDGSTGIPSLRLALFVVMLSKAHLTSHSRMSGSRWVITPLWLSWLWRSFLYPNFLLNTRNNLHPILLIFCSLGSLRYISVMRLLDSKWAPFKTSVSSSS